MKSACSGAAAAALATLWLLAPLGAAAEPGERPSLEGVVNVNTATAEELEMLPGVGPNRALAIIESRKKDGPFRSVDDLARVSGIGDRALERMRPHCTVQGQTTLRPAQ